MANLRSPIVVLLEFVQAQNADRWESVARNSRFISRGYSPNRYFCQNASCANGGEAWHMVAANEGHGYAKKENVDYAFLAQLAFWQKYLLGE